MIDFVEYTNSNVGKEVRISTLSGNMNGLLKGNKTDKDGKIIALIIQQYLHRIEVPIEEILNVVLV